MNLLSLPDEMLANVFKFSKFETICLLRKMNVRIDAVTMRYGLNKAKIYSFTSYVRTLKLVYKNSDIHAKSDNAVPIYKEILRSSIPSQMMNLRLKRVIPSQMMDIWLKKVRRVQYFNFNCLEMDDKSLDLLASMKHKNRTRVEFYSCNFKVSLEAMETVLSKFGSVRIVWSKENTIINEKFASDKVMCSLLSYAEIDYTGSLNTNLPAVTDKTLVELQRYLPNRFKLGSNCANFTIPEIIRTIKNRVCFKREWYLGRMRVETREELNRIIEEFRTIEGITITHETTIAFIVRFKTETGCAVAELCAGWKIIIHQK